jgi:AcrR family transcriptional regulator
MSSMNAKRTSPKRGRPRAFDEDRALERALRVFWKHGYEGASLTELTTAMGINRPSLYAAFGNKEGLFRRVMDRYVDKSAAMLRQALAQPTARAAVRELLREVVRQCTSGRIRGCLLVQGALACGSEADAVRHDLALRRAALELELRRRFQRAVLEGDLPKGANPAALAKYVATFQHGIAVQSAGGASREELMGVVNVALRAF